MATTLLVFHHIPKTAGTSLRDLLRRNYAPGALVELEPGRSSEWWASWYRGLTRPERRSLECIVAHGANKVLPTLIEEGVEFRVITLLRDPVELCASKYYYTRELAELEGEDFGNLVGRLLVEREFGLADIFSRLGGGSPHVSELHALLAGFFNGQARQLLTPFGGLGMDFVRGAEAFTKASTLARVLDMYLVGVVERYEASIRHFAAELGWSHVEVERRNITRSRLEALPVDSETAELVRAYNAVDAALHQQILARFPP